MADPNQWRTPNRRFGDGVRWYEHEVAEYIRNRVRAGSTTRALPPLPVPEVPKLLRG
jgi:hypothetical protein